MTPIVSVGAPAVTACSVTHKRFNQMRRTAKRRGTTVPTWAQLEEMLAATNGMVCKDCGRQMVWLQSEDASAQMTLQHYRNGSMAFVCRPCNTRHAKMPGDSFLDLPEGHKRCPKCCATKPLADFARRRSMGQDRRWIPQARCRACNTASLTERRRARAASVRASVANP